MNIFVAIPVYDGKLQVQTVKCLLEETTLASVLGDKLQVTFLPSCAVPAHGRNQLVQIFMESGCDRLVFLDSDITFDPGTLLKLAHHKADFVGGCYRYKTKQELYPVDFLPKDEVWANEEGLIEVGVLPTGFLALSRNVFEEFKSKYPDREYQHWGSKTYGYFQMVFKDGNMYSDDTYFCKEWTASGGKIFLDPEIALTHWDSFPTPFPGHIGNFMKNTITNDQPKQGEDKNVSP